MKRFVIPLFAIMLSLSIISCGGNSGSDNKEKTTQSDKKKDSDKKSKKGKKNKEDQKSKKETDESETKENKKSTKESSKETVLIDNDECSIILTGIEPESDLGYVVKARLENKSSDKTYMFSVDRAAINGVALRGVMESDVAPGKKVNEAISFVDDELKKAGIDDYTDIELTFNVYDYYDLSAEPVTSETVHIYPYGEDKATTFVREPQPSDNIIMDNEYGTAIVTGYYDDSLWGYTVQLYLINKSDKNLLFIAGNTSVNGFIMDPFFCPLVPMGKTHFDTMSWPKETFEKNNITQVDEIKFDLRLEDGDDSSVKEYVNETVTLTPTK